MSVVVQSGSKQYIVEKGQKFIVDRLFAEEGSVIDFPVLFSFGDDKGLSNIQVKVVKHQRGEKIRVVKYKSKSNYHRQYGFRAEQTILEFVADIAAAKPAKKAKTTKAVSAETVEETVE